jgi:hypothetical protein
MTAGLIGAASADKPAVKQTDPGTSSNPYTLISVDDAGIGGPASNAAQGEAPSECPYSYAPVEINSGGAAASGGPGGDEKLYSLIGSVTWIGDDGQATGGSYTLDTGFWNAASGPPSCEGSSGNDCNNNGIDDECDIALRFSLDKNDDCIPDECNDCCLLCIGCCECPPPPPDGVPNACRIDGNAFGDDPDDPYRCPSTCADTSLDDDGNGIPDECDPDCDGDGTPDAVDIPDVRIYVDATATEGNNTGENWDDAYTDLQEALVYTEATYEDPMVMVEIWVAEGVYTPAPADTSPDRTKSFKLLKCTALYGGFVGGEDLLDQRDPVLNRTVLSGDLNGDDVGALDDLSRAENSGHVVTAAYDPRADASAILDGFIITGGNADGEDGTYDKGGGLRLTTASPTISNCVFEGNQASALGGAAFQLQAGTTSFTNCIFRENASEKGAGLYASNDSQMRLMDCLFTGNKASQGGGGVLLVKITTAPASLTNCVFQGNWAGGNGGGMLNQASNVDLVNCAFVNNTAQDAGGGMHNEISQLINSNVTLHSCTIADNQAGNTGEDPAGAGGISNYDNSTLSVTNTILWGNSAEGGLDMESQQVSGGAAGIDFTLIEGLAEFDLPLSGNFDADPAFADLSSGNVRLTDGSPAIGRGMRLYLPLDPEYAAQGDAVPLSFDLDRGPRVVGAELDVGAYEFIVDCNGNGIADAEEIFNGDARDCNRNGVPDECDPLTLDDFMVFTRCLTGPRGGLPSQHCECADIDEDEDVDLFDCSKFQTMFTGWDGSTRGR